MTTIENPMGTQPIKKLLMQLAIPAMIANVVNALYNIVDQIFIGQGVGYLGNAATNIAFPITTICLALGLMTGVGAASNFNLELGRKEVEKARKIAGTAVVQLIVMGIAVCLLVQIFLEPLEQQIKFLIMPWSILALRRMEFHFSYFQQDLILLYVQMEERLFQ